MSATSGLHYDRYQYADSHEWMMRLGDPAAPAILFVPPLFEEMNRTRALLVDLMRALAADGFSCWLPDLPGTGESERPLETMDWNDWRGALAAARNAAAQASGDVRGVVSIRGGALLDDAASATCHYRFAPVEGASLARDMARSGLGGGGGTAGYRASEALMATFGKAAAAPAHPLRTVRLTSDPREADHKIEGPALWRRSEPDRAAALSGPLAHDIASWVRRCAAS